MNTIVFHPEKDKNAIAEAAAILRRGGLLGIPTETVYGLGADALNETAVLHIFEAKGRPQDNPLILHVPGADWLERYCRDIPPEAYALAERFWPGPLTMILPRRDNVPLRTTGGLDTVGVRCPDHPMTLAIIRESGIPVAAPSGNTSGRPSPTTAQHMLEDMDGKIDGIVDGGPCSVGVESTIIDLTVTPPRLLRPGGLPLEALEEVLGEVAVDKAVRQKLSDGEQAKAPGMKYRHYAPKAPVTVITGTPGASAAYIAAHLTPDSGVICFDEYAPLFDGHIIHRLGPAADKLAQAQHVFDALRTFDDTNVPEIFAQCPDEGGLGLAVSNRLKKAAGFHVIEAPRPLVVGITGPTGAGKTSALRALEQLGGYVLDCDAIYHEMLRTDTGLRGAITAAFGDVFTPGGQLDRQKLGTLVFGDAAQLERLNAIIYDQLPRELERRMAASPAPIIGIDAIHGNGLYSGATIYPTSIGQAATFDPDLVERLCRETALEMRAMGAQWTFNPNVEVARDARWGRCGELFGEDPLLVGRMGAASVRGYQGADFTGTDRVIACAKHFVGGSQPVNGINGAPFDASERTLREIFLPPFRACIEAGVHSVMAAHNEVNGHPAHGSKWLLTDLLRGEMGFKGFVVSDWKDVERLVDKHAQVATEEEAFIRSVACGMDMRMHGPVFIDVIQRAAEQGVISEKRIDEACRGILEAKFRLGLFENPFVDAAQTAELCNTSEHRATALEAARK